MSNLSYQRYDDQDPPQPVANPGSTLITADPTTGLETADYRNFNADYVARDEGGSVRVPEPYQRHDEDNNDVTVIQQYQRYDDEGNAVTPAKYVRTP